jgi:hypothetical protein
LVDKASHSRRIAQIIVRVDETTSDIAKVNAGKRVDFSGIARQQRS